MGYKLGLAGANVTAPFKEKVIPSLVYLSLEAAAVGAVNTLIYNGPNISGYNTDVTGVIRAFQINNVELKHKSLLVIGAGGAARAIVSALKPSGAEITIVNLSLIHISEPTRLLSIAYAVFCLKKTQLTRNDVHIEMVMLHRISSTFTTYNPISTCKRAQHV